MYTEQVHVFTCMHRNILCMYNICKHTITIAVRRHTSNMQSTSLHVQRVHVHVCILHVYMYTCICVLLD